MAALAAEMQEAQARPAEKIKIALEHLDFVSGPWRNRLVSAIGNDSY